MKGNISIQCKAAFLLIVFSMNMVIGFACAIGIDMGFNSCHDDDETETVAVATLHKHDESKEHHESKECDDNCCNEHVIKFAQVDKSFPQCFNGLNAIFFTTLISSFFNIDILHTHKALANIKYFVRSHHPPIPDIRVAIQSFQI